MTELICIVCPKGCHLSVDEQNDYKVSGQQCPRGEAYGKKELINPTRTLTSIARIQGANLACCPVKTNGEIPKGKISQVMDALKSVRLSAPIALGTVIVENAADTGVNWVATKTIERN